MRHFFTAITMALLLTACRSGHPDVPTTFLSVEGTPTIYPDYKEVVIPPNIAPLNFLVDEEQVDDCVARFTYPGGSMTFGQSGRVEIDAEDWHEMLASAKGSTMQVEVFAHKKGEWISYEPFSIEVANDSIDPYIAYRLIPPSYSTFEQLYICQRHVEDFEEIQIYNNQMLESVDGGHCINCHAFQNYHTDRMQFHVRAEFGGTVIYDQGKMKKVDMKRGEAISSGVYPAWHPSLNLIAYSMNKTFQNFHTNLVGKVEVQDSQGGMMLYDVEHDEVKVICNEPDRLNAFPAWSPDGKYLYYAAAAFAYKDSAAMAEAPELDLALQHEIIQRYQEVHYDIVRRAFDPATQSFGPEEMVWEASKDSASLTVPRISPDGRYLLVSKGDFGVFHIWHPESDLYVADLQSNGDSLRTYPLAEANSERAESFHNWSSNGRWILFESRRSDNNYTRLYFAYFDQEGKAHKAFELPQQNPEYETLNLRSYNVPEFMVEPVKTTPQDLARVVRGE